MIRDCEHGRLARKCEICELIQAEAELAKLGESYSEINSQLLAAKIEIIGLKDELERAYQEMDRMRREA